MIGILRLMMISMVYSKARLIPAVITLRHLDQETVSLLYGLLFLVCFLLLCSLSIPGLFQPFCSLFKKCLFSSFAWQTPLTTQIAVSLALGAFLTSSCYVNLDIHSFLFTSAFNMLFFVYGYISFIMIWELWFFLLLLLNGGTKFITRDIA